MIVYYNPENGSIVGMSGILDVNRIDPYIETGDQLAMDIFLGKEKLLRYRVIVGAAPNTGFIQLKTTSKPTAISIKDRVHLINESKENSDIVVTQNTLDKTVQITIEESMFYWWQQDGNIKHKKIYLAACLDQDPYSVLWSKALSPKDFNNQTTKFDYLGSNQYCFYTNKIFKNYHHEIKSS
jgi:hypothetical protein